MAVIPSAWTACLTSKSLILQLYLHKESTKGERYAKMGVATCFLKGCFGNGACQYPVGYLTQIWQWLSLLSLQIVGAKTKILPAVLVQSRIVQVLRGGYTVECSESDQHLIILMHMYTIVIHCIFFETLIVIDGILIHSNDEQNLRYSYRMWLM